MKTFFYSLLLGTLFIAPAWADSHTDAPSDDDSGFNIEINLEDDEVANEDESSGKELEHKIKRKVLSIFTDIIEAADEGLTEAEKEEIGKEIENEIEQAIEEISAMVDEDDSSHEFRLSSDGGGIKIGEVFIASIAILFTFGTPIMIIAAVLYSSYRKKRLIHDTIDQYVTSGKDIPDEVLKGLQKEVTPKNNLHRGLVMSGIGLGIFACFAVIGVLEAAAFGLIPLFIGLAQLLIWKLENK